MEVDGKRFHQELLTILRNIAKATFVSIDLEMSGITVRPRHQPGDRSHDAGKPSLQEHYEDIKKAAQTFQVLQIGITCVEEDKDKNYYVARPYNFNISPLIFDERIIDIERRFTFSSSASTFLHNQGFDFGKLFRSGVPYLSQLEADTARRRYAEKIDQGNKIPDIIFSPDEPETLSFYKSALKTVDDWVHATEPKADFCHIGNPDGAMNGLQRRLVYQLVRKEFPGYRTFGRNDGYFMQIVKSDPKHEDKEKVKKQDTFEAKLAKQVGLCYLFEALTGGPLTSISPTWFIDPLSPTHSHDTTSVINELKHLRTTLKANPPTLIGHNLFIDLCFLHQQFLGHLPSGVVEFQNMIHLLCPRVLDTKFMATQGADTMRAQMNLRECLEPFRKVHVPLVVLHEDHVGYGCADTKSHEAGYDSWMTAELFIKLTSKLHAEHLLAHPASPTPPSPSPSPSPSSSPPSSLPSPGGVSIFPLPHNFSPDFYTDLPPAWHASVSPSVAQAPYEFPIRTSDNNKNPTTVKLALRQRLPALGKQNENENHDPFWKLYMNKLRVAATEGGVCELGG